MLQNYKWLFVMISGKIVMSHACLFFIHNLAAVRMLAPSGLVGQSHWGDSCANSGSLAAPSTDAQLKVYIQLCQIFKFYSVNDKCLQIVTQQISVKLAVNIMLCISVPWLWFSGQVVVLLCKQSSFKPQWVQIHCVCEGRCLTSCSWFSFNKGAKHVCHAKLIQVANRILYCLGISEFVYILYSSSG